MRQFIHHWLGRLAILLVLVLNPMVGLSALVTIYDSGDTRSIRPFLDAFDAVEVTLSQPLKPATPQLGAADLQSLLPIRSPGLTPGRVQARSHDRPFARPFFLIGSDAYSRQWLQDHRERLAEIGAVGMLVQADTKGDLQAIAELANGLPILPASATDIGQTLEIRHYPVLISAKGIEQ
jgi:integrating conjugative element protein (TIGR03765 family)